MKTDLIMNVLKGAKKKPSLWRKIKIFAAVGIVGLLLIGGLTIWAGFAAFNYVASTATTVIQSPVAQAKVEDLKSGIAIPKIQPLTCWAKAQSLLAVEPWLQRPPGELLSSLKVACLEGVTQPCKGRDCADTSKLLNTAEGINL
jgi:hypothetical protein